MIKSCRQLLRKMHRQISRQKMPHPKAQRQKIGKLHQKRMKKHRISFRQVLKKSPVKQKYQKLKAL